MNNPLRTLIKLGGSLLNVPNLGIQLRRWLDANVPPESLLIVGGGALADVIRALDQNHRLSDEAAHALAIKCMATNTHLVCHLLPNSKIIETPADMVKAWVEQQTPLLLPGDLFWQTSQAARWVKPTWDFTSDSLAAAVALAMQADELILLKSANAPNQPHYATWSEQGLVDRCFPSLAQIIPRVRIINARALWNAQ